MAWLYKHSSAFLSTSHAEGFGLPLVEAMSCGLPVVAPDLPVFREIGEHGIAFYAAGQANEALALLRQTLAQQADSSRSPVSPMVTWKVVAMSLFERVTTNPAQKM